MANSIITPEQFVGFRSDISKGWEKERDKIERCITDAEQVDLFEQLGDFYQDVRSNIDSPGWADLFDGSEFEVDGKSYEHIGLKKYLAGLSYVRYLGLINATHTPHGYVNKLTQNSDPVPYNQIKDEQKQEQKNLSFRFKMIDKFLRSKPDVFRNYKSYNNNGSNYNNLKTSTLR